MSHKRAVFEMLWAAILPIEDDSGFKVFVDPWLFPDALAYMKSQQQDRRRWAPTSWLHPYLSHSINLAMTGQQPKAIFVIKEMSAEREDETCFRLCLACYGTTLITFEYNKKDLED